MANLLDPMKYLVSILCPSDISKFGLLMVASVHARMVYHDVLELVGCTHLVCIYTSAVRRLQIVYHLNGVLCLPWVLKPLFIPPHPTTSK